MSNRSLNTPLPLGHWTSWRSNLQGSPFVGGEVDGLDGRPDRGAGRELELGDRRRVSARRSRAPARQRDAHPVAVGLEVGDGGLPRVAGAALGLVAVQRDGLRADGDRHLAAGQGSATVSSAPLSRQHGAVAAGGAVEQVDADELGDVARARAGRSTSAGVPGLGDPARLRG